MSQPVPTVSVIIPALNEERAIERLLVCLVPQKPEEIIIADGGSTDGTVEIAARYAHIVRSSAGRGIQMNKGAGIARGDVLLFLHADVTFRQGAMDCLRRAMQVPSVAGGNFDIRYEGGDTAAAVFTWVNRARRRFGVFYGDSGIFCRRSVFEHMNGYKPWQIMEDYEFARRLRGFGRLALLNEPIWVSARRWQRLGLWRTLWSWFWIQGLYSIGIPPDRLAAMYRTAR